MQHMGATEKMSALNRIYRSVIVWNINHFLCGTHFFGLKRSLLNSAGIKCGEGTSVVGPIRIGKVSDISFGKNVWVGTEFKVYGNGKVNIGDNIDIAPEVAFVTGSHEINVGDTGETGRRAGDGKSFEITVENGCWIGARTTIMGDITIHRGAVVGACSLVNKNVDENCAVAGVPAKMIKLIE